VKLDELLLSEEELHEINLNQIFTAAVLSTVALSAHTPHLPPSVERVVLKKLETSDERIKKLVVNVTQKYKIDPAIGYDIVKTALKYEKSDFPRAEHLLAVIGIESSFNPEAKSKLKKDPALGLMQVRPGVWKIDKVQLGEIEGQIMHGSQILDQYHRKLKDPIKALHAYNIGITSFLKGKRSPEYLKKYHQELKLYST